MSFKLPSTFSRFDETDLVFHSHNSNEDDLTVKLGEIVFANQLIKTGLAKGVTTANLIVRPPPLPAPSFDRR